MKSTKSILISLLLIMCISLKGQVTDYALQFDGFDDQVRCPGSTLLNLTSSITVEAWIKPAGWGEYITTYPIGYGRIVDKGKFIFYLNGEGNTIYPDHSIVFTIYDNLSTNYPAYTAINTINLNQWQHVSVTYNATDTVRIYINGIRQTISYYTAGQPSGNIANNLTDTLFIGESSNQQRAFNGIIDEVRLWNIVRTQAQIQSNMCSGFTGYQAGLVGYWKFNNGPGSTVVGDSSSYTHTGTLVNMVTAAGPYCAWVPRNHQAAITPAGSVELCLGDSVLLSAGTDTTYQYQWKYNGNNILNAVDSVYFAKQTGLYAVAVTDTSNCNYISVSSDVVVTVHSLPVINIGQDTTICQGDSLLISVPGVFTGYHWQDGSTNSIYVAKNTGLYWVEVSDTNNCKARDSLILTVRPLPVVNLGNDTIICEYHTLLLNAKNPGATYFWSTGQSSQTIIVDSAMGTGIYSLTVTDADGCVGTDQIYIEFDPCPGFNENRDQDFISIQPNPTDGIFTLFTSAKYSDAHLSVINTQGTLIYFNNRYEKTGSNTTKLVDLSAFQPGIYFIRLENSEGVYIGKLVLR